VPPFPFSFWKNSAPPTPPFDPGTLNPTGWYRASYGGVPWLPTPGGGTSGVNGNMVTLSSAPTVGAALNGLTPASFDGTKGLVNTSTPNAATFVTPMNGTYATAIVLFKRGTSAAPAVNFYDDAQLLTDDFGNWGLGISSSGFQIGGYSFGVNHPSGWVAIPEGQWGMGVFQFDGARIGGDVNGRLYRPGGVTDLVCSPLANWIGVGTAMRIGQSYNGAAKINGDVAEVLTFAYKLTVAQLNRIRDYANSRYGLSLATADFDPAVLRATSWFKSDSGVAPWVNAASAGVSGAQEDAVLGIAPVFATIGGITALEYGQAGALSRAKIQTTIGTSSDIDTYCSAAAYTVMGLIYLASTNAQQALPYTNSHVLSGDARFGVFTSTNGIGVFHYTGTWPTVTRAMSTGAWHFFCCRYDSASGKVQIDVDNVDGPNTAIGAFAAFAGITAYIAKNSYTAVTDDFYIRERMTLRSRLSDADRNNYYAYLKATYPAAGLP